MIWHFLRYWTSFLVPVFYKRIQGKNIERLNVKGPVIIAMNHPNAFGDPVVFTMACFPPKLKYMARGDAFKPGVVTWLLEQLGIVPIFRIQDGGREGLKKNDEAYRRVNQLLQKNGKVIIFAEGLCVQERRLRPLKKGLARMVFGAYAHLGNDKLVIVPVGVNYSWPSKFRSNVFYNVGEPIAVKDFIEEYNQNQARAYNMLLNTVEPAMKALISHIDDPASDEAVYMAEQLCKKDWLRQQGLKNSNLDHQLTFQKHITALVNRAAAGNSPVLQEFKQEGRRYFEALKANKLRDWLINPKQSKNVSWIAVILRCIFLLAGLPLYLAGLLGNLLPLWATDKIARLIAKTREFYASMAIGISLFTFLFNYLPWFFISYALSPNVLYPLLICTSLVLCGVFSLYYHPFALKTLGMVRILNNRPLAAKLSQQREKLVSLIDKL